MHKCNKTTDNNNYYWSQLFLVVNSVKFNLTSLNNCIAKWRLDAWDILELPSTGSQLQDGDCTNAWQNPTTQP